VGEYLLLPRPLAWPYLCNHPLYVKNFNFLQILFVMSLWKFALPRSCVNVFCFHQSAMMISRLGLSLHMPVGKG
jgi:hypothetical protein